MTHRLTFRHKVSGLVALAVLATGVVIGAISYLHMRDMAVSVGLERLEANAVLNAALIKAPFDAMRRDAEVLAANPDVERMLRLRSGDANMDLVPDHTITRTRMEIVQAFWSLLEIRPHYAQVRLMGLENNEREIISLFQRDGIITAISEDALREVASAPDAQGMASATGPYFTDVSMGKDALRENDDNTPTIKLIYPLKDITGRILGAIVVDADFGAMLNTPTLQQPADHQITVLNENGDYLERHAGTNIAELSYHRTDGFQQSDFYKAMEIQQAESGVTSDGVAWYSTAIDISGGARPRMLQVVASVPKNKLALQARDAFVGTIGVIALFIGAALVFSWMAVHSLLKPLTGLTKLITQRRGGCLALDATRFGTDEIGNLAQAFAKLSDDLIEETRQANAIFEAAADGVVTVTRTGEIISANPSLCKMLGYARGELNGNSLDMLLPDDFRAQYKEHFETLIASPVKYRTTPESPIQGIHKNGSLVDLEASINKIDSGDGVIFVGIIRNITDRRLAEKQIRDQTKELRQATTILEATFDAIEQGVLVLDADLKVVRWSNRFVEVMGPFGDTLKAGMPMSELLGHWYDAGDFAEYDLGKGDCINRVLDKLGLRSGMRRPSHYVRERSEGRHLEVFSRLLSDGGVVITYEDVTVREQARRKIERLAMMDTLTGLANRNGMKRGIWSTIKATEVSDTRAALLLIDLDKFKLVNDTFGHDAGDEVLITVGRRIKQALGETAQAFRLGGDEFAACFATDQSDTQISLLADKTIDLLSKPISFDGRDLEVGASIGVAIAPDHANDADILLRKADVALYQAKNQGRGQHNFYNASMDAQERRARRLQNDLHAALKKEQLRLVYQPKVEAASGLVCGAEALLRWDHPEEGLLAPHEFIKELETSEALFDVGEWVVEEGWRQTVDWVSRLDLPDLKVGVNVGARQLFEPSLLRVLTRLAEENPGFARHLDIELTEEVLIDNLETAAKAMKRIEKLGFSMSLDDFGTTYSSISYLHHLPVQTLKIDKSFLDPVEDKKAASTIVRTIINLGRSLGMSVTAEGVETEEQVDFLRSNSCTYLQGYYFGKPMGADQFELALEASTASFKRLTARMSA